MESVSNLNSGDIQEEAGPEHRTQVVLHHCLSWSFREEDNLRTETFFIAFDREEEEACQDGKIRLCGLRDNER